jgi:hypothetical protein
MVQKLETFLIPEYYSSRFRVIDRTIRYNPKYEEQPVVQSFHC